MEIAVAVISFFAMLVSWFVLPSTPRAVAKPVPGGSALRAAA